MVICREKGGLCTITAFSSGSQVVVKWCKAVFGLNFTIFQLFVLTPKNPLFAGTLAGFKREVKSYGMLLPRLDAFVWERERAIQTLAERRGEV